MKSVIVVLFILVNVSIMPAQPADSAAIIHTALDYAEGYYSGDAARMESAIHPDLHKVSVATLPQSGTQLLQYSSWSVLVELSRAGVGRLDPEKRQLSVGILDIHDEMASVRVRSAMFNDYLAMARIDGKWKIVNVLWTPGPDSPGHRLADSGTTERDSPAINDAARNYYTGVWSGNPDLIAGAIHPELSAAQYVVMVQTGKAMINRSGPSAAMETARAKIRIVPEAQRGITIKLLDMMDGMASLKTVTPASVSYMHLQRFGDGWKIVNILTRPAPRPSGKG